jgi:hypothetical protein
VRYRRPDTFTSFYHISLDKTPAILIDFLQEDGYPRKIVKALWLCARRRTTRRKARGVMKKLITICEQICDFASDHPRSMAFICLATLLVIFGLAQIFENTIIPKILAILIIAPFVILIIAELSGKLKDPNPHRRKDDFDYLYKKHNDKK